MLFLCCKPEIQPIIVKICVAFIFLHSSCFLNYTKLAMLEKTGMEEVSSSPELQVTFFYLVSPT